MTEREALKLALEALECTEHPQDHYEVITAIKEALAQPEQEPVAWKTDDIELYVREDKFGFYNIPLYTHPPQRKPLTDEEIWVLTSEYNAYDQYGEYFEAVYIGKPTSEQIQKHCHVSEQGAVHILNGGGRVEYEDHWYNLEKKKPHTALRSK